jgi:hypothetical protein
MKYIIIQKVTEKFEATTREKFTVKVALNSSLLILILVMIVAMSK